MPGLRVSGHAGLPDGAGVGPDALPADARPVLPIAEPLDESTAIKNINLLIQLRWIAVIGQVLTIGFVHVAMGIALPLMPMIAVLCGSVFINVVSQQWLRQQTDTRNRELLLLLLLDVAALTAQLYLSGGATNPFVSLYLLQVTLGAMLLNARATWVLVVVTSLCFAVLIVVHRPLALPDGMADQLFRLHIIGTLMCFMLDAALIVVFMTRIARNLRDRDNGLATLRQRAAEEDHIVRMGLLASGAAHELGTPLAQLSVILSDWRRMPALADDPELMEEIAEMQAGVQRCKAIVTGILMSAGDMRGEAPALTSVHGFFGELAKEWREARSSATLVYENRFGADMPIVSDTALKQMIFNVLDNANEVSPLWIRLALTRAGDDLLIEVSDMGPGFAEPMLANLGKPYNSSKGRPGRGLGLFLVFNAVRKLGGTMAAQNRPVGGAVVSLSLPLSSLAIGVPRHVG